jgi:hypothetical protein
VARSHPVALSESPIPNLDSPHHLPVDRSATFVVPTSLFVSARG